MSVVEPTIDPTVVLVVANETLVGVELLDAVRRRAEKGPIRAVVVAPVNDPQSGYVVYRNSRRASAGRRVDRLVADLRASGIPAHGDVFEGGPIPAVEDILALEPIDELIVSTHPKETSGWLRKRNVLGELRRLAGDRPFEHVVSDVAARTGQVNVLVIANETVIGDRLLDRLRARAAESPAAFLLVSPQSDPDAGEHPEAERRLRAALATLRAEGIEAHGQIAHPDPYTAAMQVIEDERVDEVIISTFAGERSGWLRRDVVERLRKDAGVPVEHVVAERPVGISADRSCAVSAHAETVHDHGHHGPPPANQSSRLDPTTLGMFLFIASEAMLFGAFFTAYFFVRVVNPDAPAVWPPPPYEFPVFVASVNTAILVTSSFTIHWATQSIKRGDRNGLKAGLVVTILLGSAFLLTQAIEYAHVGFNPSDGAFASVFFGLTGLHGAHVFIGLTLLTIAAVRAFKGHFSPDHYHGVEIPGIYWHFVDVMWIVVWAAVYLL